MEKALQIAPVTSLCVTGAPAPSKKEYRIIRKQAANIQVEPTYVAGVIPPTNLLGAIGIDQFRQRHQAPPWYMEREQIRQLLQWEPIVIPPVTVTVGDIQHTLHKAPPSTPYRNLLEYKHFRMLVEEHLQDLANFYNRSLQGEPFDDVFAGDFYALPNKLPHGPIANARPLLNFTTVWKILSGITKDCITPPLCEHLRIPHTQMALWGGGIHSRSAQGDPRLRLDPMARAIAGFHASG